MPNKCHNVHCSSWDGKQLNNCIMLMDTSECHRRITTQQAESAECETLNDPLDSLTETQQMIVDQCDKIKGLLISKNQKYGDSVRNPSRIFSKASAKEQILVRIDDKLNRIMKGTNLDDNEDTIQDLIGYLIMWKVVEALE